jgi:hypothetical protein
VVDTKISDFTAATVATGGVVAGVQGGANRKFTLTAAGAAMVEAANAAAQKTLLSLPTSANTYCINFYFATVDDRTIPIFPDIPAAFAGSIIEVRSLKTVSGTVTASFKIGSTDVTSLASLSVTATPQSPSATGANTVVTGNTVNLVLASNAAALGLSFTLVLTRT